MTLAISRKTNIIYFTGRFQEDRLSNLLKEIDDLVFDLEQTGKEENITLNICSGGGNYNVGLAIYERIKAINNSGSLVKINTHASALVGSIAYVIWLAGHKRTMDDRAYTMIHNVANRQAGGTHPELEISFVRLSNLREILADIIFEETTLQRSAINKIFDSNLDHFFNKEESLKLLKPRPQTKVTKPKVKEKPVKVTEVKPEPKVVEAEDKSKTTVIEKKPKAIKPKTRKIKSPEVVNELAEPEVKPKRKVGRPRKVTTQV